MRQKIQEYLEVILHLASIFVLLVPFDWDRSTIADVPLVGVNDPDPAEAVSATLFQYFSLIFVVWLLLTETFATRTVALKPVPVNDTGFGYFSALERLLPRHSVLTLVTGALVTVAFIAIHEYLVGGEGVAIPIFLFETLPLALILVFAIRGFQIGAAPLEASIWAACVLLLLPLQLHWHWLMLPLLYGPLPALLVSMWCLLRTVKNKSNTCGRPTL